MDVTTCLLSLLDAAVALNVTLYVIREATAHSRPRGPGLLLRFKEKQRMQLKMRM